MSTSPLEDCISLRTEEKTTTTSDNDKRLLVWFITGNPGLIEYYRTFLTLVFDSLRSTYSDHSIHVTGISLAGFETTSTSSASGPRNLEDQINYIDVKLAEAVPATIAKGKGQDSEGSGATRVILIGHSVGAYILLEALRRQKTRCAAGYGHGSRVKYIGGICLFPTITHIAKSSSGRKFSLLSALVPLFPLVVGLLSNLIFSWLPSIALHKLVAFVTGMTREAAVVTTSFLQSRNGVRQSLALAEDEMRTITADRWDDELWSVVPATVGDTGHDRPQDNVSKLFFLFGRNDHWVADETRDEIIAARGAAMAVSSQGATDNKDHRPLMEIDDSGIPHGFCIKHNEPVAQKVLGYINHTIAEYW
ncbi:hypothetical protein AAFC00_003471 [Neodothiora populina]|uniref:Lipid droplet-associated hydrolase n=1 Tax=Neodothiora populina TaxID=2781224 RepID=A0ABR3PEC5_9PEZI